MSISQDQPQHGIKLGKLFNIASFSMLTTIVLVGAFAGAELKQIQIGGTFYHQISAAKDLVADTIPPPMFQIEPYVRLHIAGDDISHAHEHKTALLKMSDVYQSHRKQWQSSSLPNSLKVEIINVLSAQSDNIWALISARALPALERSDKEALDRAISEITPVFLEHAKTAERIQTKIEAYESSTTAEATSQTSHLVSIMFGVGLLLTASLLIGAVAFSRYVIAPLNRSTQTLTELTTGGTAAISAYDGPLAEIKEISSALAAFENSIAERAVMEADRERHVANQLAGSIAIAAGLEKIASGDLTFRVSDELSPEFERLKQDFNAAVARLESVVATVKSGSDSISIGSNEIADAAENLSRRTESQAASLEETTAALKEITSTIQKAATNADQARRLASDTKVNAEKGSAVVVRAVEAMKRIETSSKEINQIIGVIDEIAFQTNLLALNAGVEAARAGDAGRGFAVVASEVRALAHRSADAAKQIKSLISSSNQQVGIGVNLVAETGSVLEDIASGVLTINQSITSIAAGAQEQSAGLSQINTAVGEMDQMTQQNAAMVEETTAATRALTDRAAELIGQVATFQTTGSNQPDLEHLLKAAVPHAFKPSKSAIAKPTSMHKLQRPRKRAAGANGKAVGWEEF